MLQKEYNKLLQKHSDWKQLVDEVAKQSQELEETQGTYEVFI